MNVMFYILYSTKRIFIKRIRRKRKYMQSTVHIYWKKKLCMCGCAQFKSTLFKGQLYMCQEPVPGQRSL